MSYYYDKYEFMGQDSAGFRGGEVEFQVSEFFEPMGMSRRILPWAPVAISVETSRTSPIPGRAVIQRPSQRGLSSSRIVAQRARGHPMRNSACMQSIHSSLESFPVRSCMHEPDRSV